MFDKETYKDVTQAIWKAREAFEKHLVKLGYDLGHFRARISSWYVYDNDPNLGEKIEFDGRDGQD